MDQLHLDLQANSRLPEVGSHSREFGVLVKRHDAGVEILDHVVEIHFAGFLVVVGVCRCNSAAEARLGVFAEEFEFPWPDFCREQIGAEYVPALVGRVVGVVSTKAIVISELAFDRDNASIGKLSLEKEVEAAGLIGDVAGWTGARLRLN